MTDNSAPKKLAIIDGKSVFYRGYYAMSNLATKDGTPTGGVFGFASMALEVVRKLKPDYVCVAWDKPKTNIRSRLKIYPEYKAGRKPAPPDFYEQVPILLGLLDAFGWPLYELDDYEADDIMGALARQASAKNIETLLITSDMDMLQLVDKNVKVYALKKGLSNIELYSPQSFEAKYQIKVDQFLDMKSLKGDSSDNIPGVPGIGEKGAVDLLKEYKTLDGVYENLALVKDSVRKKLEAGQTSAYMSKKLARIYVDAPIKLDLNAVDGTKANPARIQEIFNNLEFRSLARQLPQIMQVSEEASAPKSSSASIKTGKLETIDSASKLTSLKFASGPTLAHAIGADEHGRNAKWLALSREAGTVYLLDVEKLDKKDLLAKLAEIKSIVGYNVKHSLKLWLELGAKDLPAVEFDVLIGSFTLDSSRREQSLTDLAEADLAFRGESLEDLETEELAKRAPEIMAIIRGLHAKQASEIEKTPKFSELVKSIEWPVIPVLARMEFAGIELDVEYLNKFSDEINDAASDLEQQIYGHADQEFNIASPSQLADILFTKLDLPKTGIKKGKSGYSTAARELDKLRGQHPIIDLITQYREVTKLKNTYVDTLPKLVDENSRLHTTFNLTIAQTGRLSSTDPNLQNIPVRTDLGRRIRTAFVAGKDKVLVSADYSQFELRLAAAMAGDKQMLKDFNEDADIHSTTAAQIYGRELEDVTKQMRYAAKAINFGIVYGMSPHGLSVATGMTNAQAADFIEKYKELRKPLFEYMEKTKQFAREHGYAETMLGRRRPIPGIKSSNFVVRSSAERAAINMPIQGTEADLMKIAMINVDKKLEAKFPEAKMLLQIHDSILVEAQSENAEAVGELLKSEMEAVDQKLPVKLTVEVTTAKNWGEL
ncbi:MAG: DNA polymerase I [Candidatus Saccharimonadales bacterium]